jgi:hypothetical protein
MYTRNGETKELGMVTKKAYLTSAGALIASTSPPVAQTPKSSFGLSTN